MSQNLWGVGVTTPAAANGAAYAEIRVPALSTVPMAIRSITAVLDAATASSIGLVRAQTGGTAVAGNTYRGINFADGTVATADGIGRVITAWTVAPAIAATPIWLKKVVLPAVAGASVTWEFDECNPLIIGSSVGTPLLLWNFGGAAGSALSLSVEWWEELRQVPARFPYSNNPLQQSI